VSGGDVGRPAAGWGVAGGAAVGAGHEPYYVRGSGDGYSLSLPAGSSATSPAVFIGLLSPTTRFFFRNVGSPLGLLRVDLSYTSLLGLKITLPVGLVAGGQAWQPTLPLPLLVNLSVPPLVTNGTTYVTFRFAPAGEGAAFQIDDDYVDPYQGRRRRVGDPESERRWPSLKLSRCVSGR